MAGRIWLFLPFLPDASKRLRAGHRQRCGDSHVQGRKGPQRDGLVPLKRQGVRGEIHDGAYEINGLPMGESRIAVVRLDPDQPDPLDPLHSARQQMAEGNAASPRQTDSGVVTDPRQLSALQKKRHLLPFVYSSPNTSGLRLTVSSGVNTFDIQLLDDPKTR
jgi:hypothetical protein